VICWMSFCSSIPLLLAGLLQFVGCLGIARADVTLTTLVSFNGTNGANPTATLVLAGDGNFYGTTTIGGTNYNGSRTTYGTIFRIGTNGTFTNLFTFLNTNGANPASGLALGTDGRLYGGTQGGTNSRGSIFRFTTNGVFTNLFLFNGTNGYWPNRLAPGTDGNLYGTTQYGGTNIVKDPYGFGYGTVFRVGTNGVVTNLVSFDGITLDSPLAGLIQGADGSFYGTTSVGGTNGDGSVFRFATNRTVTNLYSFSYSDGFYPQAALAQGFDGNIYGATYYGGSNGLGTVFRLTTNGAFTSLLLFENTNGANPAAAMIMGADGLLYGAALEGGAGTNGATAGIAGTVFAISTNGLLTTLAAFNNTNGLNPAGGLALGPDGAFYGTTENGGMYGLGTIFRVQVTPSFKTIRRTNGAVTFSWSGLAGQIYQPQYRTNVTQVTWSNLGGTITATNGTPTASDPGTDPLRIYRVMLLP